MAAAARIKRTLPPPEVCVGCYWRHRHEELTAQNKDLRRELIRKRARGAPAKPAAARPESEVVDLVDEIKRMGGG